MDYDKYFSEMQSQLDKQFDEARRSLDQQLSESLSAYTQKQSDVEDFANSGCKFCPECGTIIEMEVFIYEKQHWSYGTGSNGKEFSPKHCRSRL